MFVLCKMLYLFLKKFITMKKIIICVTLIATSIFAKAQMQHEKGMHIEHIPFTEVLEKAKKENKHVFVDCYTTWCGPCKWMAANTFTDDTVGLFFNHFFINLKMDMEHGEGPSYAPKFRIEAYPTFLFMQNNGTVIQRDMGAKPAATFIAIAKQALGADANLDSLILRFKAGNKSAYNLQSIIVLMKINKMDYSNYLNEYFKIQNEKDFNNEENFNMIKQFSNDIQAPEIEYMIKNKPDFEKKYAGEVNEVLKRIATANSNGTDKKKAKAAAQVLKQLEIKK
jgi:thiol-disulfide isomerase/thioredoxin